MDGETARLIVVALGAIIAGIAGQLIAGAFNSRNTIANIEAARVAAETQREADRDVEHDRWLRDRKVEVYSKFLEEVHELELSIAEAKVGYAGDGPGLSKKARNLSLLNLRVLAPRLVVEAAQEVVQSLRNLIVELISVKDRSAPDEAAFHAATEDFRDKVTLLELRISKDLGIEVMG
ncbi:hypothetical protein [Arthrobacter sp. OY3WO11]|uniref:hypothetical protein n=1 Tax=Arthrobacter sp. OY3WO11 TaxID=1835723 RepID=UPI0007CFF21D|nr:hypothetical protein [Arthrobacter sp. OY3WO11]OAE01878.1 hypothetical protein A6A22_10955 [Arthrobacter sp. OY3WO11]